jgi:dihydrofolate reductase
MKKRATKISGTKKHRTPSAGARRKIIVYIAVSADYYIARPNGGIDWLDRPHPKGDYGMPAFFRSIDTILWGRKTYTQAMDMGLKLSVYGPGVKNYVFSRQPAAASESQIQPGVEFVKEPIKQFAQKLRAQPGKDIWMMGGGEITAAFLDVGEIDEFSIHVIPVLIGEGIPLIAPRHRNIQLALLSTKKFSDGVVHLNYRVDKRVT